MNYDYRVIRRRVSGLDVFQVHRVFYRDSGKTQPVLIERVPASIIGREPLAMLKDIELVTDGFEKSTIYIPEWSQE